MVNVLNALAGYAGGETTIFSVNKNYGTTKLTNQLHADFEKRVQKAGQVIQDSYSLKITSSEREMNLWKARRDELEESYSIVNSAHLRLESMERRLQTMIENINAATQAEDDTSTYFIADGYAAAHDAHLRSILKSLDDAPPSENLLASNSSSVDYPYNMYGNTIKVYGTDISTHYYIEEADGTQWHPDQDTKLFRVYDSYPFSEADGTEVNSMVPGQGLQLDNFSDPSVDFTTYANSENPVSYSGTLNRSGLEVLNSWLYGGMETLSDRERAKEDIYAAIEVVKLEKARYDLTLSTINHFEEIAKLEISGKQDEIIQMRAQAAEDIAIKQDKMMSEFQSVQSVLAQSLVLNNQYRGLIPTGGSSFAQSLLDVQI